MTDVTLRSGKIITVDTDSLTTGEWRRFARGTTEDENTVIRKCTGLTDAEIDALPYLDTKAIVKQIVISAQSPLADPS